MCLAVLSWQPGQHTPLAVVANRDEFRHRKSLPMHWWADKTILAGKDLQAGGTWLGFNPHGHFALLTNIRPGFIGKVKELSRGELITGYLTKNLSIEAYQKSLRARIHEYSGFNLILGDKNRLFWFSSTNPAGKWLEPGIYGLSNDSLNTPWPKTKLAIQQMTSQCNNMQQTLVDHSILSSTKEALENTLPETGVPLEWEKKLSAQTIIGQEYGTRCRTHFIQRLNGLTQIAEQQLDEQGQISSSVSFTINAGEHSPVA